MHSMYKCFGCSSTSEFYIKKHFITGQKIDTEQLLNIRTLIKISSYKGFRHARALPVNGQRTRSNSKTARKLNRKK